MAKVFHVRKRQVPSPHPTRAFLCVLIQNILYIQRETETDGEREREREIAINIYIYIERGTERQREIEKTKQKERAFKLVVAPPVGTYALGGARGGRRGI
jgi:hypothetical protein